MSSRIEISLVLSMAAGISLACNLLSTPPTPIPPSPTEVPPPTLAPPTQEPPSPEPVASPTDTPSLLPVGWLPYENRACSFQIGLPPDSIVSTPDATTDRIDLPFAPGTNLQEKYLQVACRPAPPTCASPLAAGYEPGYLPSQPKQFNGVNFTYQAAAEGAAGSLYQWSDYSTLEGGLCLSLSFVLHSTNALNYDPPLVEYDSVAESSVFEEMMATFQWVTP